MLKKLVAFFAAAVICIASIAVSNAVSGYSKDDIANAIEKVISYKENKLGVSSEADFINTLADNTDSYETQWYLIALSKYGIDVSVSSVQNAMVSSALKLYKGNSKATDFQRTTLALYACGLEPQSIDGKNILADAAYNSDLADKQGINAYAYALIALDCKSAVIPSNAKYTRKYFIDKILSLQLSDGGFAIIGTRADADVTAMCIQALAPYCSQNDVKTSVNNAVNCLSEMQNTNGTFSSFGTENAESIAQVISALVSLDIDPTADSRFIKNGINPVTALLTFQNFDGGFAHLTGGKSNSMATYQSLNALVDYYSYLEYGDTEIFDFEDNKSIDSAEPTEKISEPEIVINSSNNSNDDNSAMSNVNSAENKVIGTQSQENDTVSTVSSSSQAVEESKPAENADYSTSDEVFLSTQGANYVPIPTTEPVEPVRNDGFTIWDAGILFYTSTTVLALIAGYLIIYKAKFLRNSGWHRKKQDTEEENEDES